MTNEEFSYKRLAKYALWPAAVVGTIFIGSRIFGLSEKANATSLEKKVDAPIVNIGTHTPKVSDANLVPEKVSDKADYYKTKLRAQTFKVPEKKVVEKVPIPLPESTVKKAAKPITKKEVVKPKPAAKKPAVKVEKKPAKPAKAPVKKAAPKKAAKKAPAKKK